ncbi:MAG: hypothetical protein LUH14_11715 [Clostridiaceae bacterium]|nr:hypothetical protein [Clostridiaceae bacterium]
MCFCQEFHFPFRQTGGIVFSCVFAALAVFVVLQEKKRFVVGGMAVVLCIVLLAALFFGETLQRDINNILYYLDRQLTSYNGSTLVPGGVKLTAGEGGSPFLLLLLGGVSGFYMAFMAFRCLKGLPALVLPWSVVALGLLMGVTPGKCGFTLLFAGTVFLLLFLSCRHRCQGQKKRVSNKSCIVSGVSGRMLVITGAILAVSALLGFFVCGRTEKELLSYHETYQEKQLLAEEKIKDKIEDIAQALCAQFGMDSDGLLSNREPKYNDEAVMRITMEQKPTEDVYLKGYVGSYYQNGQWYESDTDRVEDICGDSNMLLNINYLDWVYYYGVFMNYHYSDSNREAGSLFRQYQSEITSCKWKLEYVGKGKNSKYSYCPYFSDLSELYHAGDGEGEISLRGDNGIKRKGNELTVTVCTITEQQRQEYYNIITDWDTANWNTTMALLDGKSEKISAWSVDESRLAEYLRYVREEYVLLPEEGLDKFKLFAARHSSEFRFDNPFKEASFQVSPLIQEQADYSTNLSAVPSNEDYVENFLLTQKAGYCEHFATAGTLLLRYYGYPARYVAGYKVPADAFRYTEDGYQAEVLDSYAHAWSDVYMGAMGWCPVEMTPSAQTAVQEPAQASAEVSQPDLTESEDDSDPDDGETESDDSLYEEETSAYEEETAAPDTEEGTGDGEGDAAGDGKLQEKTSDSGYGYEAPCAGLFFAAALLLAAAMVILFLRRRRTRYSRLEKKMGGSSLVRFRTEELQLFLRDCGVRKITGKSDSEWFAEACRRGGRKAECAKNLQIMEKAYFAGRSVSEQECLAYLEMTGALIRQIGKRAGRGRKFLLRLLGWGRRLRP